MPTATLNYCIDTGDTPVTATTGPGGRLRVRSGGRDDPREVEVHDLRQREQPPALDTEGFALVRAPTAAADLWDEAERGRVYDPECEALIRRLTGAAQAVVFDHTLRSGDPARQVESFAREPVQVVHNDYTPRSARWRLDAVRPEQAEDIASRRFAVIQIWRAIGRPALAFPLALCEAGTLRPEDLVATERRHADRVGEIYQVQYSARHRWWYAPAMEPDEALVFKVFDSADDGRARFGAHSSFEDPTTPPDAPPRESIEVRALALW